MKLYRNESIKVNGILIFLFRGCCFLSGDVKGDRVLSIENRVRWLMAEHYVEMLKPGSWWGEGLLSRPWIFCLHTVRLSLHSLNKHLGESK